MATHLSTILVLMWALHQQIAKIAAIGN
ncbi:Protein trichome birefringence-like 10 [Senna tora]|uniref:Protein trichome birefringence-like 10 n=1 Tax=Senna tora TaxID=362788 RepID=A0A834WRN1_9FABA|nr:Protein trichome birefringence-like 10 [Senna tora]